MLHSKFAFNFLVHFIIARFKIHSDLLKYVQVMNPWPLNGEGLDHVQIMPRMLFMCITGDIMMFKIVILVFYNVIIMFYNISLSLQIKKLKC